ncbi:hypothetical protein AGOR_G00083780 [Albula goreensis]|uniref:Uncharacterized protein n=1 Tax=Albula goreensis TaxID=1534307 RepID=A0A8T3DQA1_9TELE|nr:hypothetical protein AGOR_G00083780 [Albula goreensis]
MVKVYDIVIGNTLGCHRTFMERLAARNYITLVEKVDECDFIVAFCPISSRAGTDIDAARQRIPDGRPAILVLMHHTFDPFYSVPDSNRRMSTADILVVNCLFYEDQGLLNCGINDSAIAAVQRELSRGQTILSGIMWIIGVIRKHLRKPVLLPVGLGVICLWGSWKFFFSVKSKFD